MNFDEAAAEWVRRRYENSNPIVGTVEFDVDASAYGGELDATLEVCWYELRTHEWRIVRPLDPDVANRKLISCVVADLFDRAYSLQQLLTEIVEIASEDTTTSDSQGQN